MLDQNQVQGLYTYMLDHSQVLGMAVCVWGLGTGYHSTGNRFIIALS